ncbi:MAG: hypothetical protein KJ666_03440 [Bacteroidetes bacterium]|nr:hypothetical protein [Bacteroidota bacterium]
MSDESQTISRDIFIEDLIELKPSSVKYLMDKGIRCLVHEFINTMTY